MRYLIAKDVRSLISHIPDPRERLAALFMFNHGIRRNEITALCVRHIDAGLIDIRRGKGSARTVQSLIDAPSDPLVDEVTLLQWVIRFHRLGPDDKLFPGCDDTYYRAVKAAGIAAGLPAVNCTPTALRHSLAMYLLDKKMDIRELQKYMGHKSLNSTGFYLEATDAQASATASRILKEAV